MDTDDLFHTSSRRIQQFAEMQVRLYRHDPRLQQYFMQLQLKMQTPEGAGSRNESPREPRFLFPVRLADTMCAFFSHRRYKADILFCPAPYFDRKTENRLTARTLIALTNTGATVLCLLPSGGPIRRELETQLATAGRSK